MSSGAAVIATVFRHPVMWGGTRLSKTKWLILCFINIPNHQGLFTGAGQVQTPSKLKSRLMTGDVQANDKRFPGS